MEYEEKILDGIALLKLKGPFLSEPDAMMLRQHFYKLVDDKATRVVMDLSKVTHINSCGLGLLVSVLTTLKRTGGQLRLADIPPNVRSVLTVTGLVMIFDILNTPEEALKSLR